MIDLSHLEKYRENNRLEAKRAQGGLPHSIWETYSAFANSFGGLLLLGVIEDKQDKTLASVPLPDPEGLVRQFWQIVNDPARVSANILQENDVWIDESGGNRIVIIRVPRAHRHDRPVYIGGDPFSGSYRRNGEGDYHCTPDEVRTMMRDQADLPQDLRVLEGLDRSAFHKGTVARYRARLLRQHPGHVWGELGDEAFLHRVGAMARGQGGRLHPTAAGLLLLGRRDAIRRSYPHYRLTYREQIREGMTYRLCSDNGSWSGNLFDFYFTVADRICRSPLLTQGQQRPDQETPVQLAIREALANALIHADYQDRQGLVIQKQRKRLYITNPGCFRADMRDAMAGGVCDPRNAGLTELFRLVGVGRRAGSGLPQIRAVWRQQGWAEPTIQEHLGPDSTSLLLSFEPRPALPPAPKTADGREAILDYLTDHVHCTLPQLAQALGFSQRRTARLLEELTAAGAVEPAPGQGYQLKA